MHYHKNFISFISVFVFIVAVVFGSMYTSPMIIAALLVGAMYAVILVGQPKMLLFLAMFWMLFEGPFSPFTAMTRYLDNVFLLIFFALMMGWYIFKKAPKNVIPDKAKIFVPALACVFISAVMSGGGLSAFKMLPYYYITYFAYIMFFLVARVVLTPRDIPRIIYFFAGYMIFQYIMNLGYQAGVNPIPQVFVRLRWVDFATGSLSTGLHVAYYCLLVGFLIMSLIDNKAMDTGKKVLLWGGVSVVTLHNFILTNTNHAILLFAGCAFSFSIFVARKKIFKMAALLGLVLIVPISAIFQSWEFENPESGLGSMQKVLSWNNMRDRWEYSTKHGPKMEVYYKAFIRGQSDLRRYLFGVGGSRGISPKAMKTTNPVAMDYVGEIYLTTTGTSAMKGGSIMERPITSVSEIMVELGLIGLACYYLPFVYLLYRIAGFYRKGRYSRNQSILAGALIPFIILTLFVSGLTQIFNVEFYYATIWVLAGLLWDPEHPEIESEVEVEL